MWSIKLLLVAAVNVVNVQNLYKYRNVVLTLQPQITDPPTLKYSVDQHNVTMTCRVLRLPHKPEVKWLRKNHELTGEKYQVLESGDLFILNVTFFDAGLYTCNVVNMLGDANFASVKLIVKKHTKFISEPQDYEVLVGTPVTLRSNAVADRSLKLTIEWQIDGETIDSVSQPRFVMTNDGSLTILKPVTQDTGVYVCIARTNLDNMTTYANLNVIDKPNAPELDSIDCHESVATINFRPNGDNHSPILYYIIQHKTSFIPNSWEVSSMDVPGNDYTYSVDINPWVNYTFRVTAVNKVGPSLPSEHSDVCTTQPSVPFKNPDNVEGQGTEPNNLVIRWTPMSEIEHNAPRFRYRVYWQLDTGVDHWNTEYIFDWRQSELLIGDQETFRRYRIKVWAINDFGLANVAPKEVIGYSGEGKPVDAPTNFTLITVTVPTSAILSWNPVTEASVRGHFKGYKIQTWTELDSKENFREVLIAADSNQTLVTILVPDSINYVRILAYNGRFDGPSSMPLSIHTPEGVPDAIQLLYAIPLGSTAFWLKWKRPLQTNGKLTGYKIYYEEVKGTSFGRRMEREPHINGHRVTEAKLSKLNPNSKYRIHVVGTTNAGEGADFHIIQMTGSGMPIEPDRPNFSYELQPVSEYGQVDVKIFWQPNLQDVPGSHFSIKYRLKGETQWVPTDPVQLEMHHTVHGLKPNSIYEFCVVSIDRNYSTESYSQEINTSEGLGSSRVLQTVAVVTIVVIAAFIPIIVCIIKRNRNNHHRIQNREISHAKNEYVERIESSKYKQPRSPPSPVWRFSGLPSNCTARQRCRLPTVQYDYASVSPPIPHRTQNTTTQSSCEIYNSIYEDLNG